MVSPNRRRAVVVLGATGFLGQAVTRMLRADEMFDQVVSLARSNVDLLSPGEIKELALPDEDLVAIFLAGRSPYHGSDPQLFLQNVDMLRNFLQEKGQLLRHIVFASSADVYGPNPALPVTEETYLDPQSPYARSKLECERALFEYKNDMSVTIFRIASVYGEEDDGRRAITGRLLRAIKKGTQIELIGDGNQLRDLTYVEDVAAAFRIAIQKEEHGVLNMVSGHTYSINQIIEILQKECGLEANVVKHRSKSASSIVFDNGALRRRLPGLSFRRLEEIAPLIVRRSLQSEIAQAKQVRQS